MTRTDPPAVTALATLLRHHRTRVGLTQRELARRTGYSRSTVANAETGDVRSADFYRRCDEVLDAGGALVAARDALTRRASEPLPRENERLAAVPPEEAIEHLRRRWHELVRTDNLLGPRAALPGVLDALRALAVLDVSGPARTARRCLTARYAVTAAWLYQDTGRPADATTWAGRALEHAHESDDRATIAWALHRQSRLAEPGDPERARSLARAALRQAIDAQRPLAAALHVQSARAAALTADRRGCEVMLARAALLADAYETHGDDRAGYGGYCTQAWVAAVRGECALRRNAPADAVRPLRTALALLAPAYRRNRGIVLGRLAEACTRLGEPSTKPSTKAGTKVGTKPSTKAATKATPEPATDAGPDAGTAAAECRAIGEATGSASVLALTGLSTERSSAA